MPKKKATSPTKEPTQPSKPKRDQPTSAEEQVVQRSFAARWLRRIGIGILFVCGLCSLPALFPRESRITATPTATALLANAITQIPTSVLEVAAVISTETPISPTATYTETPLPPTFTVLPPTNTVTPAPIVAVAVVATQPPITSAAIAASPTTAPVTRTTYYVKSSANVRLCPRTSADCAVIQQLSAGTAVVVIGQTEGENTNGSALWYQIEQSNGAAYVHSSVVSTQPITASNSSGSGAAGGGSSTSGGAFQGNAAAVCAVGAFDYSVCNQYTTPRTCPTAVAMGIPSRTIACCFPDRDSDDDGDACWGN
jgi:uncharacterized membrane protein YgcG